MDTYQLKMLKSINIFFILICATIIPLAGNAATTLNLGDAPIATLTGVAAGDFTGQALSAGGDINGDGYADVLISAYRNADSGDTGAGAVFVVYGTAEGISSDALSGTANTVSQLTGTDENYYTGFTVAGEGDINGDGYDDFVISSHSNDDTAANAGAAYIVYGQANQLTSESLAGSNNTVVTLTGNSGGDQLGLSLDIAGDVNNDGYDDVIVSAPFDDTTAGNTGSTYVVYGQSATLISESITGGSNTVSTVWGEASNDLAGLAVGRAGDVNGDGYDDLLVGSSSEDSNANNAGAVYVVYGQSTVLDSESLAGTNNTVRKLLGEEESDAAGTFLDTAGDVNGDGYDDVLIAAASFDGDGSNRGAVYMVYGESATLTSEVLMAGANTTARLEGEADNDGLGSDLGRPISATGDVNNDGYADILIGAQGIETTGIDTGTSFLVMGSDSTLVSEAVNGASNTIVAFVGEADGDFSGTAVNAAGDITNDGYPDLLVSAYSNDAAGTDAGAAYVIPMVEADIIMANTTVSANTIECAQETYTDAGATATDPYTNEAMTVTASGSVNTATVGDYAITYSTAENTVGIRSTAVRSVTVEDTTQPSITVSGNSAMQLTQGDTYTEQGATATDICSGSVAVTTSGSVDTSTAGTYTINYVAEDVSGNTVSAVRTVIVEAPENTTDKLLINKAKKKKGKIVLTRSDATKKKFKPFNGKGNFRLDISTNKQYVIVTNSKVVRVFDTTGNKVSQAKVSNVKVPRKYYRLAEKKLYGKKLFSTVAIATTILKDGQVYGKLVAFKLTKKGKLKKVRNSSVVIDNGNALKLELNKKKKRVIAHYGNGVHKETAKWKATKKGKVKAIVQ